MFVPNWIPERTMLALDEHPAFRCDGSAATFPPGDSAPLSALAGSPLGGRFRSWRGRSGRRYTFSVYDPLSCPAYEQAVLIVAATGGDGERRIVLIGETGCFPDVALAKAARLQASYREIEFHVHLLARSRAERAVVIADFCSPPPS
jgi:hypothetical protein